MAVELKVPEIGESITQVEIGGWLKQKGDYVERDEPVCELETDKATVEVPAPVSGTITEMLKEVGDTAEIGEVIAHMEETEAPASEKPKPKAEPGVAESVEEKRVMPAAQRVLAEQGVEAEVVEGTGPGGRVLKEDALQHVAATAAKPRSTREDTVKRMTPIRRRIAERLLEVQQTAALLTTFNEVNMRAAKTLRADLQEEFQERYGVKLGFMSFFIKAAVAALEQFPSVNSEIRGADVIFHNYFDVGIAVSSAKGLVVPVLRDADRMTFADIERAIADLATRAKVNKIGLDELEGGTFSITNGGVFGSMLSTPIVNPPQSAILGMHAIQDRPVAEDGQVVIRPVMYVALTYDHRIVDGREAVLFLRAIKERIENPAPMLLEG